MQNATKNSKATAQGVVASTRAGRKTASSISEVHPLLKITKKELISLIEGKTSAPSISDDTRYSLILAAFLEWVKCEDKRLYATDVRDNRLLSRLNAIREAFQPVKINKI